MILNNSDYVFNNASTEWMQNGLGELDFSTVTDINLIKSVTSFVTDSNTGVENVTEIQYNITNEILQKRFCEDWRDAQHAVFQLAHLCILIAFLTPSNFKHHCFFLRIMLCIGYLLVVIWSVLFMCMTDVLSWNAVFLLANITHLFHLGYRVMPDRFTKTLDEVYNHSFKPLRITRKQFKHLVEFGNMVLLPKGALYAKRGRHKIGQKLSILLKGR